VTDSAVSATVPGGMLAAVSGAHAETDRLPSSLQRTTRRQWIAVLAACASPLLLLIGSRDWLLSPRFNIDPWTYVAFFYHYADPNYLSGHYKLARLPWILSGWLVHRVVSDPAAAYVLHATFLIAGGCAFFVLLRTLFGNFRLALLGAMLIVFYVPFHGSGGWDYHNTAAGPLYLWALVTATLAAVHGGALRALLAGVMAALAVHTNITYGVFLPVLAAHYLFVHKSVAGQFPSWRSIATAALSATIGAVGVTALLSAINVMVGREALFFSKLLGITLRYTGDTHYLAGWWLPWSAGWFWTSPHLALATVTVPLSVAVLMTRRAAPLLRSRARLVALEFLIMAAVWTAWQFAGNLTIQWDYFMFPLQPHVVLALMALAAVQLTGIPVWLLVATPVFFVLPLSLGVHHAFAGLLPFALSRLVLPAVCFLVAGAATWIPSALRVLAFVVLFAVGNAMLADQSYSIRGCHDAVDAYSAIVAANRFVAESDPPLAKTFLWFDEPQATATSVNCPLTVAQVGYALGGTGIHYIVNPFPMPSPAKIPGGVLRTMMNYNNNMAIVSIASGTVEAFERRAQEVGVDAVPFAARQFAVRDARFELTLLHLQRSREADRRIRRLPGVVIKDWSRDTLAPLLLVYTYAAPRRDVIQRGAGGDLLFVPATPADHVATAFFPVPVSSEPRVLLVAAEPGASKNVNCVVSVQDQSLRLLDTVPCGDPSASMEDTIISLPADVTSVRIFFHSATQQPMVLPGRLRISYSTGAVPH
jgi:hypothetical protein